MGKIKKIILSILIVLFSVLFIGTELQAGMLTKSQAIYQLNHLNKHQLYVLNKAYSKGVDYDLGLTLAAIAWEESNFGMYNINLGDGDRFRYKGSYSPYHILLHSICKRLKIKSNWKASRLAEKLVYDLDYSTNMATVELLYWQKYWEDKPKPWSHLVASYNAGYKSYKSKGGVRYLKRIKVKVRALKIYLRGRGKL